MTKEDLKLLHILAWSILVGALSVALAGTVVWGLQGPPPAWYLPFFDHLADWFVAAFTGLLAFVTYRLVMTTNKLWESDDRRFSLEQRAWLSLSVGAPTSFFCDGQTVKIEFSVDAENIGKTPAFDVRLHRDVVVENGDRKGLSNFKEGPRPSSAGLGDVLFPGQEFDPPAHQITFKISRKREQPGEIFSAQVAFCIFYNDTFRRECRTGRTYALQAFVPDYLHGEYISKNAAILFQPVSASSFAT